MAFRLAQLGHRVTRIDARPENVTVSRLIREEHSELDVAFVEGDVVDSNSLVNLGDYDLVIGFSVLHHIALRDGHAAAVSLVSTLSEHIPHAIFEMALASEAVQWAQALPADPRVTLAPFAFVREIGLAGMHRSDIRRPILFASQTHALTKGGLQAIVSWERESHAGMQGDARGLRRYYFVPAGIVKITARFTDSVDDAVVRLLRQEQRREAHTLETLAQTGIDAPELIEFVDGAHESILFRTAYPGVLLSEVIGSIDGDLKSIITGQVLESLARFEAHRLYHADLRLWNVVWDPDEGRAHIIDFGALSPLPEDMVWPNDTYFSFLVWLVSLWGPFPDQPGLVVPRFAGIDRAEFPARVISLIATLMTHDRDDFVFRDLSACWNTPPTAGVTTVRQTTPVAWHWLSAIERFAQTSRAVLTSERDAVLSQRDVVTTERDVLASERDLATSQRDALAAERDVLVAERDLLTSQRDASRSACEMLGAQREAAETRRDAAQAELDRTLNAWSWRLTRPLRRLRAGLRK